MDGNRPELLRLRERRQKTLYAWAKDAAGNVSARKSATVTITILDITDPR